MAKLEEGDLRRQTSARLPEAGQGGDSSRRQRQNEEGAGEQSCAGRGEDGQAGGGAEVCQEPGRGRGQEVRRGAEETRTDRDRSGEGRGTSRGWGDQDRRAGGGAEGGGQQPEVPGGVRGEGQPEGGKQQGADQ